MKTLINTFVIAFVLLFSTKSALAQSSKSDKELPHSIIYLIRPQGGLVTNMSITFKNQKEFMLYNAAIVQYKLFSEGEITITLEVYGSEYVRPHSLQLTLNVKRSNTYYVMCKSGSIKEVPKSEVEKRISKSDKIVKQEEDLDFPISRSSVAEIGKKEGKGQGTCFLINADGYLITSFHCVENAKEITIKGVDGDFTTKYGVDVVGSDPSNDLALLKLINKNVKFSQPPFAIRSSGVMQAEKIYALGFPVAEAMGKELKITEGIISAKSGMQGDMSKYQISAVVNPGNSGGPLIDDQGNIIGVIFAKATIADAAGYAVKASYLETFLNNIDGFSYTPTISTFKEKPFTEKIAELKKYIFILESN